MISERIRKLAQLTPIHEEKLDQIMGEPIVDSSEVVFRDYEYFWRPRYTEVQEAHREYLDGNASRYEKDHISPIRSIAQYGDLGPLSQDVVVKTELDPTDLALPGETVQDLE